MSSPTEITVQQLSRLIGTPEAPVLVDVCIGEDFAADPRLIPTAFRHPFDRIADLAPRLDGREAVIVCQRGRKLSHGAAALLCAHGIAAVALEGGNFAWHDAGLPLVPAKVIPAPAADGATLWVTRQQPGIDGIACPWLIRRFVDPLARFMFVPRAHLRDIAERFGATPFDFEDTFWSRRGDRCSFDTMVEEFALSSAPLERLATVVRGAETDRHDLAPESAGLLAATIGQSRLYRDDLARLEAGMGLYDALYRWCRDAVDEGRDWPAAQADAA